MCVFKEKEKRPRRKTVTTTFTPLWLLSDVLEGPSIKYKPGVYEKLCLNLSFKRNKFLCLT